MFNIDKKTLEEYSDKLNFNRDTLEKVYRLIDILNFMNNDSVLKDSVRLNLITIYENKKVAKN